MTEETTPLDSAHLAAEADEAQRPAFYDRLLESELHIVLEEESDGTSIKPLVLETSDGAMILAFDRDHRLAAFMGNAAEVAVLSGRKLIGMLEGQSLAIALNLGGHASETILPADAVSWAASLGNKAAEIRESSIREVRRPVLPEPLVAALSAKLPTLEGMGQQVWLVGTRYRDGTNGTLLAVTDVVSGAEAAITQAINEALNLSGLDAATLDIAFFAGDAPIMARIAQHGLGFDLPQPRREVREVAAPGSDPEKPPILR
ncbi:SseB family protein [Pontivivens insulae]|uniref:SseB protein N-terminal domain-containing protein n=1 Tax=Pontivivens insulae TaxID=1639689 RepID=A0A2R8A6L4_9RHOB|nr:SseB family protein [Pontivivens insulae]RED17984.1 type III secretion system (T3SS) SseB-like protein [Pontivivens insulae]SPF27874.1 hypothetical protein POI8812_00169 [Pontivivens insulae]